MTPKHGSAGHDANPNKRKSLSLKPIMSRPFHRYWRARATWWSNQPGTWMYTNTLATVYSMKPACRHPNSALPRLRTRQPNSPPTWRQRISSWKRRSSPAAEERDTSRERAWAEWRCVKRNYGPFDKIACNTFTTSYSKWEVKYCLSSLLIVQKRPSRWQARCSASYWLRNRLARAAGYATPWWSRSACFPVKSITLPSWWKEPLV